MEPDQDATREVKQIVENIKRLAHNIGAEFHEDPEKVQAFIDGYAEAQERARAAVADMRRRTGT